MTPGWLKAFLDQISVSTQSASPNSCVLEMATSICCADDSRITAPANANNARFVKLLDKLSIIVDELKMECQTDTTQVEHEVIQINSEVLDHPRQSVQQARPPEPQSVSESVPELQEIAKENDGNDDDSGPSKPDTNMEGLEKGGEDTQGLVSSLPLDVSISNRSKYRASKLMRSQSMMASGLEFLDTWAEMPEEKETANSQRMDTLISLASRNSKLSNLSTTESSSFLIQPSSTRKLLWDMLGLCFIGLEVIVLPLQLFTDPNKKVAVYTTLNLCSLLYWSVDIFASFITAYYTGDGDLEKRKSLIAKNYLKSWFVIDVICVLVDILSLVAQGLKSTTGFVRFVKILKFFRMIRIFKINGRMTSSEGRIRSEVTLITMRIAKLLLILFFTCHCMACGWWAVGRYYNKSRFNWIDNALPSGSIRDRSFGYRYSVCFHWALSQFVASSEIFPTNTAERVYAVLSGALALVGFGSMIAGMTSSIVEITEQRNQNNKDELKLRAFMDQKDVPSKLRAEVWSYFRVSKRSVAKPLQSNDIGLLKSMPKTMFQDMCVCIYLPAVSIHPLFQCCSEVCPRVLKKLAAGSMQEHAIGIGSELFVTGEDSLEMYFIYKGTFWYNFINEQELDAQGSRQSFMQVRVAPGTDISWACELSLYVNWRHKGIMEASEACEIINLNAADFSKTMRSQIFVHKYVRSLIGFLREYPEQQSDVMSADVVYQALGKTRW
mmetsp:Transcript_120138/g.218339  ORF Transcript_120138/g.218339 Transcript_120138/m.218339 type:complete len:723 (+) Transcript_120138:2-2170(+)